MSRAIFGFSRSITGNDNYFILFQFPIAVIYGF